MNYLYLNNPTQQPIPRTFVFNKRNEKIDWRRIAGVDVDRVARDLDFQVLQDNIEQITLCNIDIEVDSRAMDPNFTKLYKMAQLTIEYLLLCQDQITTQLVDYEQIKGKSFLDQEDARRQIEKLKNDLNETKKESKKRKKLIETQQKMLMAQHSTHHTCPVCAHSFLSVDYLQAHIHRRHPEYDPNRRREHDVDIEKEIQRLKEELNNKQTELQLIKVQKAVDEEKIRDRDENIRQLKEEIQSLSTKLTILDEKYFTLRSSTQTRTPSPHRREGGVKELLKENKTLRAENEQLRQSLQSSENNLKKEQKSKRRFERENQNLQTEINNLKETIRSLQNASGDANGLSQELTTYRNRYNEERNRRKRLEEELNEANNRLARLQNQPPPITDRKSPVPPPRSGTSSPPPPPPAPIPIRPIQTTEIFLPQYCPTVVRRVNEDPRFLNNFRNNTKNQFIDELEQYENLGVNEKDTRLPTKDFQKKMNLVEQTRQNIQQDLPNFERIRNELSRTVDKLAKERMNNPHGTNSSIRSSGGKLVTFEDQSSGQQNKRPSTVQPKSKSDRNHPSMTYASDEEKTNTNMSDSDDYTSSVKPGVVTEIQPSPRKKTPTSGVSALVPANVKPAVVNNTKTVAAIVRPPSTFKKYGSESSDSDSPEPSNVAVKTRVLDQKLNDISSKGQKPSVNAIAQGFRPSPKAVASQNDNDDKSDSSFTSVDDTNIQRKPSTNQPPHISGRDVAHNQHLSSGDISQYTYDSLLKTPAGKVPDFRRPPTADSAKTSNVDSDVSFEEDNSN